jgi:hypothetical protein
LEDGRGSGKLTDVREGRNMHNFYYALFLIVFGVLTILRIRKSDDKWKKKRTENADEIQKIMQESGGLSDEMKRDLDKLRR